MTCCKLCWKLALALLFATVSKSHSNQCFEVQKNTVLEIRELTTVADINSVEECQIACLESYDEYNFVCKSVMFMRGVDECVLSRHNSVTRPDNLKEDLSYSTDYYENICWQGVEEIRNKVIKVATKVLGIGRTDKIDFEYQEEANVGLYSSERDQATTRRRALKRPGPVTRHYVPPILTSTDPTLATAHSTPAQRVARDFTEDTIKMVSNTFLVTLAPQIPTIPDFLKPTTLASDLPAVTIFGHGFQCFHYKQNSRIDGYEEYRKPNLSLKRCLLLCSARQQVHCASINYDRQTKECIINGGSALLSRSKLAPSPSTDYFENRCKHHNPTKYRRRLNDEKVIEKCFAQRSNQIIEDFNGIALDEIANEKQCILECGIAKRTHRTACVALNWIANIKSCILFPKIAQDLAIRESSAVLIENNCAENDVFGDSSTAAGANKDSEEDYYSS